MRRGPASNPSSFPSGDQDHPAPDPDVVEHLQDPLHFGTRELEMPAGFRLLERPGWPAGPALFAVLRALFLPGLIQQPLVSAWSGNRPDLLSGWWAEGTRG